MPKRAYGRLPKTPDEQDFIGRPTARYAGEFVDLSDQFPDPPYDQLTLGGCVSNATAAAIDFARRKQGLAPLSPPSRLFLYYNGRSIGKYPITEDTGLQIRDGIHSAAKYGAPPEAEWQYEIAKFADKPPAQAYTAGAQDEAVAYGAVADSDIDSMIASGWPVQIGFDVYSSFEDDETARTGVMQVPDVSHEQFLGGHAILVVSTPKDGSEIPGGTPGVLYRKARNSWGHDGSWGIPGQPGYFWMPVTVISDEASDFWQITLVTSPDAPTPPLAPDAVTAAARALAADPSVARFTGSHHFGYLVQVANLVKAVTKAVDAS